MEDIVLKDEGELGARYENKMVLGYEHGKSLDGLSLPYFLAKEA
jgi:hypothetical protein